MSSSIVYHRSAVENSKSSYTEYDDLVFFMNAEGRALMKNSVRLECELRVLKDNSGTEERVIQTDDIFFDNSTALHTIIDNVNVEFQNVGNVEQINEYSRMVKMTEVATRDINDYHSGLDICELKAPTELSAQSNLCGVKSTASSATADDVFDIDRAMREIRKHKPDVVVDDYIGLIDVIGVEDNRLRIDNIMKQYKRAAKTYGLAAILVSQLNRACEDRSNKRPILRDLRDSGSIEQDAEMILFMYYDWRYNYQDSMVGEHGIEVVLGKNRYGKTGSKVLGVVGDRCKILNSAEDAMYEMKRLKKEKDNGS